jgi:hypothetical protein
VPSTLGNRAELTGAVFMAIDHGLHGSHGVTSRGLAAVDEPPPARVAARARASR